MRRLARMLGAWMIVVGTTGCTVPRLTPESAPHPADRPLLVQGVEIRVLPNAWQGYPSWLPQRFTPMWLYFVNRGNEAFDITYFSMQLVDEMGESHPAVPPTLVSRELFGDRSGALGPELAPAQSQEPAQEPGQDQGQPQAEPPAQSKPPRIPAPEPLPPASPPAPPLAAGAQPPDSNVFFGLAPYQMAMPGTDSNPTTGSGRTPFGYQPPFSPFGEMGIGRNAADIVGPALREGRLLPNTHAEGFVYFRANRSARRQELRLSARNEREGGAPLVVVVPFTTR